MEMGEGGRRLARVMALCAGLGVVIVPIAECVGWALSALSVRAASEGGAGSALLMMFPHLATAWGLPSAEASQVTTAGLIAGWLIGLVGGGPLIVGLWSVRRTFMESAEGRPFSETSVRSFRLFAWASFAAVIAAIVERSATGVAISTLSPQIQDQLGVAISSDDVSKLFGAVLFVAVAHMFAEGRRLAEDVEAIL